MSENGRKPVKKISASAAVLLTLKVEVQSPYNRIINSYNRKGHRAFAVFLLSIFVGKCRRIVSDVRCRSPPLHLDFKHFKNSDGRYLRWSMHQEKYISKKVAAMWNYPTRSFVVAGNPTRLIWTSCLSPFRAVCLKLWGSNTEVL